jgi:hypothetical protein
MLAFAALTILFSFLENCSPRDFTMPRMPITHSPRNASATLCASAEASGSNTICVTPSRSRKSMNAIEP